MDSVYFHGVVHPPAQAASVKINYALEDVRKICQDLPGTVVKEMHKNDPVGTIVHAYMGEDNALRVVGRVDDDGTRFEPAVAQMMLLSGAANGLSLSQKSRLDCRDASICPLDKPLDVSFLHVSQAGRGPECKIDAVGRRGELDRILREASSGE